jgi:hypothetical protein
MAASWGGDRKEDGLGPAQAQPEVLLSTQSPSKFFTLSLFSEGLTRQWDLIPPTKPCPVT